MKIHYMNLYGYAAVNRKQEQLAKSASGGVFAAVATYFLESGGVVFGASLDIKMDSRYRI